MYTAGLLRMSGHIKITTGRYRHGMVLLVSCCLLTYLLQYNLVIFFCNQSLWCLWTSQNIKWQTKVTINMFTICKMHKDLLLTVLPCFWFNIWHSEYKSEHDESGQSLLNIFPKMGNYRKSKKCWAECVKSWKNKSTIDMCLCSVQKLRF